MPLDASTKPIEDSVAKVEGEVAVGEDLTFQRKWWKFESAAWIFFTVLILLDLAGVFGRGPVAKAERRTSDGTLDVKYERIERASSPSIMTIDFGRNAIRDGKIRLFVSESIVRELGTQRVIPAPATTEIGSGGLTYTFPANALPATVQLALEPAGPGVHHFVIGVEGAERIEETVIIFP